MLSTLTTLITSTQGIAVLITGILMTISFIAFLIVIIAFLIKRAKGDANGMQQSAQMLWWSVFAMFIMVAVWGITYFLSTNLGIGIGGCTPKPSAVPGVAAPAGCDPTSSGSAGGLGTGSARAGGVGASCTYPNDCGPGAACRGGICVINTAPDVSGGVNANGIPQNNY